MSDAREESSGAHRSFAVAAFNAAWELIETVDRTPAQDREMLVTACASRWHWGEIGTAENLAIADWQVAHVASLLGHATVALQFARAAYDRSCEGDLPPWLRASTAEGMARAAACAGDRAALDRYTAECRLLLSRVEDEEDRTLIATQLAAIPAP